jgi:hypothetical protein
MENQRGRKSQASLVPSLAIVPGSPGLRPDPPAELTAEEQAEWIVVVERMPAAHFPRETWGLLADYCRFSVNARWVGQGMAEMRARSPYNPAYLKDVEKMMKMQKINSSQMASLATKLRLTPATRAAHRTGAGKILQNTSGKRPWQRDS